MPHVRLENMQITSRGVAKGASSHATTVAALRVVWAALLVPISTQPIVFTAVHSAISVSTQSANSVLSAVRHAPTTHYVSLVFHSIGFTTMVVWLSAHRVLTHFIVCWRLIISAKIVQPTVWIAVLRRIAQLVSPASFWKMAIVSPSAQHFTTTTGVSVCDVPKTAIRA